MQMAKAKTIFVVLSLLISVLSVISDGFAQQAQADTTKVERPKFSTTPT